MTNPRKRPGSDPRPRNVRFGEFWFGRLLSLITATFVLGGTAAGFAAGVRGADAVQLLTESFWALLVLVLVYNGRAAVHDRLADVIRVQKGRG